MIKMLKSSSANLLYSIREILKENDVSSEDCIYVNNRLWEIIQELEDRGYKEE